MKNLIRILCYGAVGMAAIAGIVISGQWLYWIFTEHSIITIIGWLALFAITLVMFMILGILTVALIELFLVGEDSKILKIWDDEN